MAANVFRVALIVEGEYLPAWQCLMLQRLQAGGNAVLVAVIFRRPVMAGWWQRFTVAMLRVVTFFDGKLFKSPLTAQMPASLLDLLGDVTLCEAGSKRYQQWLASQPLDLAIDLSGQEPLAELLAQTRFGIWRYFHGHPAEWRDRYVGMREYAGRQDEILSGVTCCRPDQPSECLFFATTSTDPASINRGIERTLWKMADFIPQRLHELAQVGEHAFFHNASVRARQLPPVQPCTHAPGLLTLLAIVWRYPGNLVRKLYIALFRNEQWVLLTRQTGNDGKLFALDYFRKLIPPRDRFWADPFVVMHDGEQYVFFEELLYGRGIGHLACIRLNADGSYSEAVTVLEKPYHLSYPFIFQYQGQYYLIPETAANRTVEVYRCEAFPHRWVFEKNLMTGVEAYDATLLEHGGRWWMFVSMRHHPHCSPNEALYLFHADSPLSTEWQAHPQNPVVALASHARPAGRIFEQAGKLYRPSQNCAGVYGRGLNINLITQLDTHHYSEETISHCMPDGEHDMNGLHTLGIGEHLAVSDAVHVHRRLGGLDRWLVRLGSFFNRPEQSQRLALAVMPLLLFWFAL